jgi:hypothetical protein
MKSRDDSAPRRFWSAAGTVSWSTARDLNGQVWIAEVSGLGLLVVRRANPFDAANLDHCRDFTGLLLHPRPENGDRRRVEDLGEFKSARIAMDGVQREAMIRLGKIKRGVSAKAA